MSEQEEPIEQRLRNAKYWFNAGECCGQTDSAGICAAPACVIGTALELFYAAADEIERQQNLRHEAEATISRQSAEIERLTHELNVAHDQAMVAKRNVMDWVKRCEETDEENDRLRAALEPFACDCEGRCDEMEWAPADNAICARRKARHHIAALRPAQEPRAEEKDG